MGKKRKAGTGGVGVRSSKQDSNSSAKLRIDTFEDVADSEDEFHVNRDEILLDEAPAQKKQRQTQEEGMSHRFAKISVAEH